MAKQPDIEEGWAWGNQGEGKGVGRQDGEEPLMGGEFTLKAQTQEDPQDHSRMGSSKGKYYISDSKLFAAAFPLVLSGEGCQSSNPIACTLHQAW